MSKNTDIQKMQALCDTLNRHAHAYYVLDNPTISDKEYDVLYDELCALEKSTGIVLPDSPTQKVGSEPLKGFKTHTHLNRLYSLDKCNSTEELAAWCEKLNTQLGKKLVYTLEYKLDGLNLCLTYKDGLLQTATTRGNGLTGEVVTAQVSTIRSVPQRINYQGLLEVQGEGIMRLSAFKQYNQNILNDPQSKLELLKNPRNGVAGAIRNLDPKVTRLRNLDAVFYHINFIEEENKIASQADAVNFLKDNYFRTEKIIKTDNVEELIRSIEKVDKSKLDYLVDGMVIKVDEFKIRDRLGFTSKFPKWAIAFKFEAEEVTTELLDCIWQVGRTGKLTPLAILEPVELAGATVARATLNNYGDILRKKVKIGSRVFVRRSNDVIPEILGVSDNESDKKAKDIVPPAVCPSCGSTIVENGAHLFCPNLKGCSEQVQGRIKHFVSRDCMDIEGISEKAVAQICGILGVTSFSGLYKLTYDDLTKLDGFKDKKINNLLAALEKSKTADLSRLIGALGIFTIGKKAAKDLAVKFGSLDALKKATREELLAIHEFGEIMADSVIAYFKDNFEEIEKLQALGLDPKYERRVIVDSYHFFANKKVVLTGTLSIPRKKATEMLEAVGAEVVSSVTKVTDFIIAGEDAGSKLDKAQKLKKAILSEEEFLQKF